MKNMAGFIPLFLLVFFLSFIFLTAVSVYTVKQMTERSIQESNQVISQVIKDHHVYRQLLGHPAPRTRTQVAELKLAVTRTPKKVLSANFITPITPKIGYFFSSFPLFFLFISSKSLLIPSGSKLALLSRIDIPSRY